MLESREVACICNPDYRMDNKTDPVSRNPKSLFVEGTQLSRLQCDAFAVWVRVRMVV